MFITKKQLEVLATAPFTDTVASGYNGHDGWDLGEESDDGRIEVRYRRFTLNGYERFITEDGKIERWDVETNEFVEAENGFEALVGSYVTTSDQKEHRYRY